MSNKKDDLMNNIELICPTIKNYDFIKVAQRVYLLIPLVLNIMLMIMNFEMLTFFTTVFCIIIFIVYFYLNNRIRRKMDVFYDHYTNNMKNIAYEFDYLRLNWVMCLGLELVSAGFMLGVLTLSKDLISFLMVFFMISIVTLTLGFILPYYWTFYFKKNRKNFASYYDTASSAFGVIFLILGFCILLLNSGLEGLRSVPILVGGVYILNGAINHFLIRHYIKRMLEKQEYIKGKKIIWELRGQSKESFSGVWVSFGLKRNVEKTYYYIGWYEGSNFESTEKYKLKHIDDIETVEDYRVVTNDNVLDINIL